MGKEELLDWRGGVEGRRLAKEKGKTEWGKTK